MERRTRRIGLDVGSKHVGVAISDPLGHTASNLTTIARSEFGAEVLELKKILEQYNVAEIVVGMPFSMDGSKGPQAQVVQEYIDRLKGEFPIPIISWDERLTTISAKQVLKGKKAVLTHQVAAAIMLQSYLDRHRGT